MRKCSAHIVVSIQGGVPMRGRGLRGCCGGGNSASSRAASIIPSIQAGSYRQKVTIQTPTLIPDNRGGGVYTWSDVATVWARVETYSAGDWRNRAFFEYGQLQGRNAYLISMRYGNTLTTKMRTLFNFQALQIDAIENVDSLNWEVRLYCREVDPGEP